MGILLPDTGRLWIGSVVALRGGVRVCTVGFFVLRLGMLSIVGGVCCGFGVEMRSLGGGGWLVELALGSLDLIVFWM